MAGKHEKAMEDVPMKKIDSYAPLVVSANHHRQNPGQTIYPNISVEHPTF